MKRSSVLVIEAGTTLSRSIAEFLESHTYQVTLFSDAPAALDHLQDEILPNIVLLGVNSHETIKCTRYRGGHNA